MEGVKQRGHSCFCALGHRQLTPIMAATADALRIALVHSEVGEQKKLREELKRARVEIELWRSYSQSLVKRTRVSLSDMVPVTYTEGNLIVHDYSAYSNVAE